MFELPFSRISAWLAERTGWARRSVLFGLGSASVLALPPVDAWPILFLTLPPLVWMLEVSTSKRQAFGAGWWFTFGYFVTGLYWISNALLVFSASFAWMIPFALIGLPGVLAVYYGLATLLAYRIGGTDPAKRLGRVLLLAGLFAGTDMLRGILFTGFPWNTFGYAWSGVESLSQPAAWIGVYGLGVLVLLSGLLPAMISSGGKGVRSALIVALCLPALAFLVGFTRLGQAPDMETIQSDPALPGMRMVQANIPQREKWARDFRTRNFERHLSDSAADRPDWVTTVIWPETAATFFLSDRGDIRAAMAQLAIPENGLLLTGAPRNDREAGTLHNAMVAVDGAGRIVASYDKAHLVPFGEYVPLAAYLPFGKITAGKTDFTPGEGPRSIPLPGLPPVSPLICYEVIFPGAVTLPSSRPGWMLNATNDAWYGETAGPYQHLQHARMRSVEEGLPLVRPANTGISIAFDGYGREIGRVPLESRGVLDFRLPPALEPTFFARYGSLIPLVLVSFCLVLGGMAIRR